MAGWGGSKMHMEDTEGNTTDFSMVKSSNNFLSQSVEGPSGLTTAGLPSSTLQTQYQQMMNQEEQAEQIHSGTRLLQKCEKMRMEHKKARIELEKEVTTDARNNEPISVLKGKVSELQWNLMNQEMQMKKHESQKQELTEQLDVQRKKWQDASQQILALQAKQVLVAEKEQKIHDLQQKLSLQEQDASIVKNMKAELAQFPKMERELQQLREENAYLRNKVHMDDTEGNTTVFSIVKSFNNFLSQSVEETSGLTAAGLPSSTLQTQYQQMMKQEEQAEQILSETRLLQMQREKMQMELSHKKARIELEKEVTTNARNYERENDRNQQLVKRLKQCQDREAEEKNKLKEQIEINKSCQKNMESLSKMLQEKDGQLAEATETISVLKGKVSELQWNLMNQEMQMKKHESQKQELTEQLDVQRKKWQDASQQILALQAKQVLVAEKEQKIHDLQQKLSLQEQDASIVKNMKAELAQFSKMERELQQLREENAYLREMKENNEFLKEEVEGLQRKLERCEKIQMEQVALELENEKLQGKLNSWEQLDQTSGLNIKSPDDLSSHIIALQQRELVLKEQNLTISSSARLLEKARKQLQEELLTAHSQFLEEKKKREKYEAMVRCLQKRVQLLIKERDGMRAILDSYDSELSRSEHVPQPSFPVWDGQEMMQKLEAHCSEMEDKLSQALGEAGNQKQRADMLEVELRVLKSQAPTIDPSIFIAREEGNALRLKVEELEAERSRLEEENRSLEMKLEQITLQGGYHDPSKTKVLHFSMNPASLAKQQRLEDQLQLREECERLREMVKVLEGGRSLPERLEGAVSLQSPQEVTELKKQVESAELKNQRLKEVFRTKIQEFRKVCYNLTGYQIDMTSENQYRLTSIYAEHQEDCLIFKAARSSGTKMQLLETEFSRTIRELINLHLLQQDSIPAFLSAITLDLFSRQTIA